MKIQDKITFGEIRQYISRIDRVSICIKDTRQYSNYNRIKYVPNSFDGLYLYGIGMIESEFNKEELNEEENDSFLQPDPISFKANNWTFKNCIEIVLSERLHTDDE